MQPSREREASSAGDMSTRSALRQAKRDRRQRAKEGEVDQAFAGSDVGDSCEDSDVTEILAMPAHDRRVSDSAWATPLAKRVDGSAEKPRTKRENLRRGKRELLSGWCQGLDNQKRDMQVLSWMEEVGPVSSRSSSMMSASTQSDEGTPRSRHAKAILNASHAIDETSPSTSLSIPHRLPMPPIPSMNAFNPGSATSTVGPLCVKRESLQLPPQMSPFETPRQRSTNTPLPSVQVVSELATRTPELAHSNARATNNNVRHSRPRDTLFAIQGMRESPHFSPTASRTPSAAPPSRPGSPFGGPSSQHSGAKGSWGEGPCDSGSASSFLGTTGIRVQRGMKDRNMVAFNEDVYDLTNWDDGDLGLFVVPTETLDAVHGTSEANLDADWALEISHQLDSERSTSRNPQPGGLDPLHSVILRGTVAPIPPESNGCTEEAPLEACNVLQAYFSGSRTPFLASPRDEIESVRSTSSDAFAFAHHVTTATDALDKSTCTRLFSSSTWHRNSVVTASSILSQGTKRFSAALPEHRCRAIIRRIQSKHVETAKPPILPQAETSMSLWSAMQSGSLSMTTFPKAFVDVNHISISGDNSGPGLSGTNRDALGSLKLSANPPFIASLSTPVAARVGSGNAPFTRVRTYSEVVSRYVSVDTLVHAATSYTQQLANPTSGAGHRSFRREHEGWLVANQSVDEIMGCGDESEELN